MQPDLFREAKILDSWTTNAPAWVAAVREAQIESRRHVTDQAIVDAVLSRSPQTVLDVGCGEGWLARRLAAEHIQVVGIDAVPELIEAARRAGSGDFRVVSYEALAAGTLSVTVDVVVSNFALIGKETVDDVFGAVPSLLNPQGVFIVQTLHPVTACGDLPYQDGWRDGSWDGFSAAFKDPAPWYFRTLESWTTLFTDHDLQLLEQREPIHPKTQKPASVIFIAERGQ